MTTTMSQKAAREGLGSPDLFEGGVYVTKMVLLSCLCKRRLRERPKFGNAIWSASPTRC